MFLKGAGEDFVEKSAHPRSELAHTNTRKQTQTWPRPGPKAAAGVGGWGGVGELGPGPALFVAMYCSILATFEPVS